MNPGTIIGEKYEIQDEVNRGGFGIIYKGIDRHFGKPIAVKAVDPELLGEAKYIDMFHQEARNIARLNHHNIVQVYDVERGENGQYYIVMEYLDGDDFMTILRACRQKGQPFPVHLAAHVIAEVCNGLDYAHNRRHSDTNEPLNIIHKDISPVNIMITKSGQVKIIDFGMSALQKQPSTNANEILVQGNIRYLAPEQIRNGQQPDRRVDVFAAGLILYETLLGERLIKANSQSETLEILLNGNWDLSRLEAADIPGELKTVIRKAIAHDREHRYAGANQMYKDLLHFQILTTPSADFNKELPAFVDEIRPELETLRNGDTFDNGNIEDKLREEPADIGDNGHSITSDTFSPAEEPIKKNDPLLEDPPPAANLNTPVSEPESGFIQGDSDKILTAEPIQQKDAGSSFYSFVDSEDDGQKTIIDIVRLSARSHKKGLIAAAISLFVGFLTFTAVDTFAHFTILGSGIYDFLFPPAIKIISLPEGADVFLDDKPLVQKTPVILEEINPGNHKLVLSLAKYESIVKLINVPRKGDLRVSGETKRHASQPFILKFKQQFELVSEPAGAGIIIDGIRLNQKTPVNIYWEVGQKPTVIEMDLAGFPRLTGLTINSMEDRVSIEDNRLWHVRNVLADKAFYHIQGVFHKEISVLSNPQLADIVYDEGDRPIGVTGLSGLLTLPVGDHLITLRKKGYLSQSFNLSINQDTPGNIRKDLQRIVRIFSKDVASEVDRDLGAKLVSLTSRGRTTSYRGTTPAILQLLPYRYTAKLKKAGFKDQTIEILPNQNSVIAKMEPNLLPIIFQAIDAITNAPINAAEIGYQQDSFSEPISLGITGTDGQFTGKIQPGHYEFYLSKQGYQRQTKSLTLANTINNKLTFRLTVLR